MDTEQLRGNIYSLYQLDWMQRHGHSIQELIAKMDYVLSEKSPDAGKELSPSEVYSEFLSDFGFGGECFVCFDEFMQCEYLDSEYIKELCDVSPSGKALYRQYEEDSKQIIEEMWRQQ